jgi:hypothetical protein
VRVSRLTVFVCLALAACQGATDRPSPSDYVAPRATDEPDRPDGAIIVPGDDGGCGTAPAGEFCGQTFLREVEDPPNVYFVVDRSGSMGEVFEGSSDSKYHTARRAIAGLLRDIGHRVKYGAAVFPSKTDPLSCTAGEQIFRTTRGDPVECAVLGRSGPLLADFNARLASFDANGATPTAATLDALLPTLTELEGDTSVVLVTDGAPNCNFEATCPTSECTLNIENLTVGNMACTPEYNCCDPGGLLGQNAPGYCVDTDATEHAVEALAAQGIKTYVIGLPGAEPYAALLDRLAVAGGTARGDDTDYYAVGDADALAEALHDIGTGIAIRCSIDLETPPEDPTRVNVYFDGEIVPSGDDDGWIWDGDQRIEVRGESCDRLRSGNVLEARVVFGCDTIVR